MSTILRRRRLLKDRTTPTPPPVSEESLSFSFDYDASEALSFDYHAYQADISLQNHDFDIELPSEEEEVGNTTFNEVVQFQLFVVGHDDETGEPVYQERPCASNDNRDTYEWDCTDSPAGITPTPSPTLGPIRSSDGGGGVGTVSGTDGDGEGGDDGSGTGSAADDGEGNGSHDDSADEDVAVGGGNDDGDATTGSAMEVGDDIYNKGTLAYECGASSELCNLIPPEYSTTRRSPWSLLGPCNFNSTTNCPDPHVTNNSTTTSEYYETGSRVSMVADRWVYTCMGHDCNDIKPSLEGISTGSSEKDSSWMGNSNGGESGSDSTGPTASISTANVTSLSTGNTIDDSTSNAAASSAASSNENYASGSTGESETSDSSREQQSSGWKLTGGCLTGQGECPDGYNEETWYFPGDDVSTVVNYTFSSEDNSSDTDGLPASYDDGGLDNDESQASHDVGVDAIGVGGNSNSSSSSISSNITDGTDATTTTATDGDSSSSSSSGDLFVGDGTYGIASYAYECTSDRYCNTDSLDTTYPPGNLLGLGWTFNSTCQKYIDCPAAYNQSRAEAQLYHNEDRVTISSDYLNTKVIGSISCPDTAAALSTFQSQGGHTEEDDNIVLVPFVYEVESSQVSTASIFLPRLEEQILLNLADSMMPCLGGGRTLRENQFVRRNRVLNQEEEAEFVVGGIVSKPDDVSVNEGHCTNSSPGADNCFIIDGRITLLLNPINDISYNSTVSAQAAMDATQFNLEESMEDDDLLSPNMPEVIKVQYLGDNLAEFLAWGESDVPKGGIPVILPLPVDSDSGSNNENVGWGLLWGLLGALLLGCAIILCSLFAMRRLQSEEKPRDEDASGNGMKVGPEQDSQAVGGDFDWEDWNDSFDAGDSKVNHGGSAAVNSSKTNDEVVLHVGNVGPNTNAYHVRELFEQHGKVNNCIVPQDHQGRASDGGDYSVRFALLTMPWTTNGAERAEAEIACVNVNGQEVDGHVLEVQEVTTLYVGNIRPDTSEDGVRNLFEQHGSVTSCIVPSDHQDHLRGGYAEDIEDDATSSPRGRFALVVMPTDEASDATNHVHGMEVDGSVLSVRDMKLMNGGRGIAGGGLAAAALAAGCVGAVHTFDDRGSGMGFNPQGKQDVKIHVGNLGPETTEADVQELFEEHGTVKECIIPFHDKEGGNSTRRFALVTMPADEAESACNCVNGMEVDGNQLSVREAHSVGMDNMGQGDGGVGAGLEARNLMDDTSTAYDNSYSDSRRGFSKQGNKENSSSTRKGLGAMGTLFTAKVLLKSLSSRKKKKPTEEETSSLVHFEPITARSDGNNPDTEQSLDDGLDSIINTIDSTTDTQDRRNFVIDPPGAFHLGNHHYTGDGVRYFSPLCDLCIAARADADGVMALSAINEDGDEDNGDDDDNDDHYPETSIEDSIGFVENDDLSYDLEATKMFTDFSTHDLGRFHSSMHVRHCKSTTCTICQREKGVQFVKARKE